MLAAGLCVGVASLTWGVLSLTEHREISLTGAASDEVAEAGTTVETRLETDEVGSVLVQVTLPTRPRFAEGAPVVVTVPTFFTPDVEGFHPLQGLDDAGIISLTLMYPGRSDGAGQASDGEDDFGGADSLKALRDVIMFALGKKTNTNGKTLAELSAVPPLYSDVGLYAFSHPGIAATAVLATYADDLQGVKFFVGRENPTLDLLSTMELGHWESVAGKKVAMNNALYRYSEDYHSTSIDLDYRSVQFDAKQEVPFFDLNGNKKIDDSEYVLGKEVPRMFGKRFYSRALLHALEDNGALTANTWPKDLATPQEADAIWPSRESVGYYSALSALDDLYVMLVFAQSDHVQTLKDKPHVHQAFDGFTSVGRWVRLNPDKSYVLAVDAKTGAQYVEHPANVQPNDWLLLDDWAFVNAGASSQTVPLAAVLEMADRAYANQWSDDLEEIIGR